MLYQVNETKLRHINSPKFVGILPCWRCDSRWSGELQRRRRNPDFSKRRKKKIKEIKNRRCVGANWDFFHCLLHKRHTLLDSAPIWIIFVFDSSYSIEYNAKFKVFSRKLPIQECSKNCDHCFYSPFQKAPVRVVCVALIAIIKFILIFLGIS